MKAPHLILYVLTSLLITSIGCARRIPISYEEAKPKALVKIETFSGKTWTGEIQEKQSDFVLLRQNRSEKVLTKINRAEIAGIKGGNFVYNANGEIISEWGIQERQGNKNFILYTIGGAGLSFGASFFLGSLFHRGFNRPENGNRILWAITGSGTTIGTYFFSKSGQRKDRMLAIEEICVQRYNMAREQIQNQKSRRQTVQQELEKEKTERAKQEAELKRLQEVIEKKKKEK